MAEPIEEIKEPEEAEETAATTSMEEYRENPCQNFVALERALSYLSWRDLDECRLTCRVWAEAVDSVRRQRPAYTFTLVHPENEHHFEADAGPTNWNAPAVSFLFVTSWGSGSVLRQRQEYIDDYCDPGDGPLLHIESRNIFRIPQPLDDSYNAVCRACGLSIPNIDGVKIDALKIGNPKSLELISPPLEQIVSKNWIKCIIAFPGKFSNTEKRVLTNVASYILCRQPMQPQFAVAGGFVDDVELIMAKGKVNRRGGFPCVIFSVPKSHTSETNFKAYSKTIRIGRPQCFFEYLGDVNEAEMEIEEAMENVFREFSEQIAFLRHSIGLIFVNCNYNHHTIVKGYSKSFPETPLLGCTTLGEVGINSFACTNVSTLNSDCKDVFHSFSIILIILTWNPVKTV